ncbi:hypothetical protein M634_19120 [Vibrio parahaemolyticus O1:Kuk str. FDA_R31]|nr:hypothetical protein M634_19120 [Vibrio parahaemolyticus O1:Kuk str. FDA_R31]ODW58718.1 hypothetical protein BBL89_21715 [Vibrio parahaemolyticus]ODW72215.1 hypothetical protein BBL90_06100 [Vibrio parahaemolyticus]
MKELIHELSLLDTDALYLFTVDNVRIKENFAEFDLTILTSSQILSRWLITCKHCLKAQIDHTNLAREVTIKYDIFIVGTTYFSGSHFEATRLTS